MSKTPLEQKIQNEIMRTIRTNGGYVYKNAQSMYTQVGIPDLTACIPTDLAHLARFGMLDAPVGLFVGIEVKRKGKLDNVSDAQYIVGHQIEKANGIWLVTDNVDDIETLIRRYKDG